MVELVEYQVALTDGGGKTFASTSLLAKDDPDAQGRAKDWAAFLESRWEDAWLNRASNPEPVGGWTTARIQRHIRTIRGVGFDEGTPLGGRTPPKPHRCVFPLGLGPIGRFSDVRLSGRGGHAVVARRTIKQFPRIAQTEIQRRIVAQCTVPFPEIFHFDVN
jgi:hypothetical protein